MFICGSASFGHQDEDDCINSYYPNPKRSRRSISFAKIIGRDNHNKNPYAERGLDKFYALLAELDDKKQKIYTEMGSEDIASVHFVYSHDSDRVKPIIVKVKDKKPAKNETLDKSPPKATASHEESRPKEGTNDKELMKKKKTSVRISSSFKVIAENLRKPYYYLPIFVMLVLLFLAIYGRAFAILCASVGLYMVPIIFKGSSSSSSSSSSERKLKRKKELVRKQSDKKILSGEGPSSPKSVINGLSELKN